MLSQIQQAISASATTGSKVISTAFKSAIQAIGSVGGFVLQTGRDVLKIGQENLVTSYYSATHYTMPAALNPSQPQPLEKGWGRRIADVLLSPITTFPGLIAGGIIAPTVYYSFYINLPNFFKAPISLLYSDRTPFKRPPLEGKFFGHIGVVLGLTLGLGVTIPLFAMRMIIETGITTYELFVRTINWSVSDVQPEHAIAPNITISKTNFQRTRFEKILGGPLVILLLIPVTTIIGVGIGRLIINSIVSTYRNLIKGLNTAVSDMHNNNNPQTPYRLIPLNNTDKRNMIQRGFGLPGELLGLALGTTAFIIVGLGRVVINSLESAFRIFCAAVQLPLQDTNARNSFILTNDARNEPKYGYSSQLGYPGIVLLGLGAAIGGIITGSTIRLIIETWISITNTGREGINFALQGVNNFQTISPVKAQRKNYERLVGILGYPIGAAIISPITFGIGVVRYVITNIDTAQKVFHFFVDAAFEKKNVIIAHHVTPVNEIAFAQNDAVLEVSAVVADSEDASDLIHDAAQIIQQDGRPWYVQLASFPGAIIGGVIGGGLRTIIETTYATGNTLVNNLQLALYQSRFATTFQPMKANRKLHEQVLGSVGYVIGSALSLVPIVAIGIARYAITNGDTAQRVFIHTANLNRRAEEAISPLTEEDKRHWLIKVASFPGAIVGGGLGFTGEIGLNSINSFTRQVKIYSKQALMESGQENKIETITEDPRTVTQKIMGSVGLGLGTATGLVSFLGIGLGRIILNSGTTTYHTIRDMTDFVFLDDYPSLDTFALSRRIKMFFSGNSIQPINASEYELANRTNDPSIQTAVYVEAITNLPREDKRKNVPFLLGLPGLITGFGLGLVSSLLAGSGRIALNSFITAYDTTLDIADLILPKKHATTPLRAAPRSPMATVFGYPGKILGLGFGIPVWLTILSARIIVNTVYTARLSAAIITTLPPISKNIQPIEDPRTPYGFGQLFGMLGYPIGLALGLMGFAVNIALHIIGHSLVTGYHITKNMVLWSMGNREQKMLLGKMVNDTDKRTPFEKYAFGFPGSAFVALGAALATFVIATRIILINFQTTSIGFKIGANLALSKPYPAESMQLDNWSNQIQLRDNYSISVPKQILQVGKYLVGSPGLMLGGGIGVALVTLPLGLKNWVVNTILSFAHLSRSLVNVGLEEPIFSKGIAADQRSVLRKASGSLGYVAALGTAGLVPVITLTFKFALFAIAFGSSALVAPIKLGLIIVSPRFKATTNKDDIAEQPYKNLYSALSDGKLPANQPIPQTIATGGKGVRDFLRKSMIFNSNTMTESILNAKLEASRNSKKPFDSQAIKETHRGFLFFTAEMRRKHDASVEKQFNDINGFIDGYLENPNDTTPAPDNVIQETPSYTELLNY
ncbi:MAG: hypothetical protein Q8R83_09825 [Legionellaceae bacterium]|nr:hypothetical protein [Legionellaceae bacterium]